MKPLHPLTLSAAMAALLMCTPSLADGEMRPVGGGPRHLPPPPPGGPFVGFPGVYVIEREIPVIVEREVVREVPVPVPAEPPPPPRKPYAIGERYASLPGGCMKLIDQGASYYHCSGEWYRQVGSGSSMQYMAVKAP